MRLTAFATFGFCAVTFASAADEEASRDKRKEKPVKIELALYFAPEPSMDPEEAVKQALKERFTGMSLPGSLVEGRTRLKWEWKPTEEYAPPTLTALKYFSRGVSEEEVLKMAKADRVFILDFEVLQSQALEGNKEICALIAELAKSTNGYPWDEECRLIFSGERWHKDRVEGWQNGIPQVSNHVAIHSYRDGEMIRMITLGMRKFGQPDLVVAEVSAHDARNMGHLINACAQQIVEGSAPKSDGFLVNFAAVKHDAVRTELQASPEKGATGKATLGFQKASRDEGDPENELLSIAFPKTKDEDGVNERHNALLKTLFGAADSIVGVDSGNKELAAASRKARDRAIKVLKPRFAKELEPREQVLAKFPFDTPEGGKEYMWVEIVTWTDEKIAGILQNDPFETPTLKAGSRVIVKEQGLYDYIWKKSDGTEEGNETGKIIQRLQKSRKDK